MGVTAHPPDYFSASAASPKRSPDAERGIGGQPEAGTEALRVLSRYKSAVREAKAGEHLFTVGEPCDAVHLLVRGWAYLFSPLADGRQTILHFAVPGTILGVHPEPNAPAEYSARALTDSVVHVVSYEQFNKLFQENPSTAVRLAGLLSQHRKIAFDKITSICRYSARQRVCRLLLELAVQGGPTSRSPEGRPLFLPLTQEHVAEAIGLSTVHVNRVLSALRKEGIVEFQHRRLRIISFAKLLAAGDAEDQFAPSDTVGPPSPKSESCV